MSRTGLGVKNGRDVMDLRVKPQMRVADFIAVYSDFTATLSPAPGIWDVRSGKERTYHDLAVPIVTS